MAEPNLSKEAFNEFLIELPKLGIVKESTAINIKMTGIRLLKYIPDGVRANQWDVDAVLQCCKEENTLLAHKTLAIYRTRLKSAVRKFIIYQARLLTVMQTETDQNTISVPIPLRGNITATIKNLPKDLTLEEADRVSNILKAYACHA